MRRYIANHGTRQPCVFSNGPATTQWFEELRLNGQGPISDNEPFSWIKDLTQSEPQRHPKPWALTSQIRSSISSTAFIGICCADEDEIHNYPSPPSTANSDGDAPLQEQLEALGFFEKPYGSFMQPQKQRSLTERRDNVLSDTVSPYAMALCEGSVFDEPSETSEMMLLEQTISLGLKSAQSLTWVQQETTQLLRAVLNTKLPKTIQTMRRTSNKMDMRSRKIRQDQSVRLASATMATSITRTRRPRREDVMICDIKPKMTAGFYMQEVWQAASRIQTSAIDAKTQKAFARLGPGIVWLDHTQQLDARYGNEGKAAAVQEPLKAGCNPGTRKNPRWKPLINAIRAGTQRPNKVVKI
ncbi:MAG: hypothetical protein Q9204_002255 [Flavoplaca sp. TL-2023a]